jgi:hypothetical protein
VKGEQIMKQITIVLVLIILAVTVPAFGGPNYIYGNIINYSSLQGGLLIMIDTGIPDNCSGTPYGWMIISQEDKAMLAVALMNISLDKMGVGVYSDGTWVQGICRVTQLQSTD